MPLHALGQPLLDPADGLLVLPALGAKAQDVLEFRARNDGLGTLGIDLAIAFVAQDQAILGVVEGEAVGHGLERVVQLGQRPGQARLARALRLFPLLCPGNVVKDAVRDQRSALANAAGHVSPDLDPAAVLGHEGRLHVPHRPARHDLLEDFRAMGPGIGMYDGGDAELSRLVGRISQGVEPGPVHEQQAALGVDALDHVQGMLDQVAVARLALFQPFGGGPGVGDHAVQEHHRQECQQAHRQPRQLLQPGGRGQWPELRRLGEG